MTVKTHRILIESMSEIKITDKRITLNPGDLWVLQTSVKGYQNNKSNELATEVIAGRNFAIINKSKHHSYLIDDARIQVRLLEDGYICWFELKDIVGQIKKCNGWKPKAIRRKTILKKLPKILKWIEQTSQSPNHYLWGGTIGPNFDCSGLIQTAFYLEDIWLPRDAYQQERFCRGVDFNKETLEGIIPGDLIFFGDKKKCSHVAIYKGEGTYWHSSGKTNGRDGIGLDSLKPINNNDISSYYLSILRGAGRVESCHDGSFIA